MPTAPIKDLLNRKTMVEIAKPLIDIASPLLIEVINYAANILEKCQTSVKAEKEEVFPLLVLYTHIIQMADAVQILVANGCGTPGNLFIRSSFEARLSIKYLLETDTRNREIAWLVKHYNDEIAYLEMMDPNNTEGKVFREKYKDDDIYKMFGPPPALPGISENITKIRTALIRPEYNPVNQEYKKKKTRSRYPEWYSLFNGPNSLRKLAEHFGEGAIYKSLYYSWSKVSHANETSNMHFNIRNPVPIAEVASTNVSHLLESTSLMLHEFLPFRLTSFQKWLAREIIPKQEMLIKANLGHLAVLEKEIRHRNKE
jgi:hypothetical protein